VSSSASKGGYARRFGVLDADRAADRTGAAGPDSTRGHHTGGGLRRSADVPGVDFDSVAVLGASNYNYAEAIRTQQVPDWPASHQGAFQFFGGVTTAVVCDQLKSGVTLSCRYEPGLQRTYEEFAQHYGTVILPARPAHPRGKPKIEVAVQIVERWILGVDGGPTGPVSRGASTRVSPTRRG
jgi:hypothetical protein